MAAASSSSSSSSRPEDLSSSYSLDQVRYSLIRQEDSLIFSLIERAQFKRNRPVYEMDSELIPVPLYDRHTGQRCSFLEYCLRENEQASGKMRRYTSPDEVAFYPGAHACPWKVDISRVSERQVSVRQSKPPCSATRHLTPPAGFMVNALQNHCRR
jgi:hypothetical protein